MWTGGTISDIANAAYDPIFWAHHAMVDSVWRLWQVRHPQASPPATLLARPLAPFHDRRRHARREPPRLRLRQLDRRRTDEARLMAERYTSEAIELPNAGPGAISRADLVFYGVISGRS